MLLKRDCRARRTSGTVLNRGDSGRSLLAGHIFSHTNNVVEYVSNNVAPNLCSDLVTTCFKALGT
jgi:hypothetical protein